MMERKPRYYVEYEVRAGLADGIGTAKPPARLYAYDDVAFMLGVAAPLRVDDWMLAVRLLRRKERTVFRITGPNCVAQISVTRR